MRGRHPLKKGAVLKAVTTHPPRRPTPLHDPLSIAPGVLEGSVSKSSCGGFLPRSAWTSKGKILFRPLIAPSHDAAACQISNGPRDDGGRQGIRSDPFVSGSNQRVSFLGKLRSQLVQFVNLDLGQRKSVSVIHGGKFLRCAEGATRRDEYLDSIFSGSTKVESIEYGDGMAGRSNLPLEKKNKGMPADEAKSRKHSCGGNFFTAMQARYPIPNRARGGYANRLACVVKRRGVRCFCFRARVRLIPDTATLARPASFRRAPSGVSRTVWRSSENSISFCRSNSAPVALVMRGGVQCETISRR